MNTVCPNCSSAAALGGDAVSVCTECASVSVAGASFSVPLMLVAAACVVGVFAAWRALRRVSIRPGRLALA